MSRMPRAMRSRLPLLLARLQRGVVRTFDLWRLVPWTLKGHTSLQDGSGPIAAFEQEVCQTFGSRLALSMNCGTAALHSAYFAVGVGPGTEVIVPAYTWNASATPVLQCGAVPVFCDIDRETLNADPDDIERRITPRTRAICVVHIWGNPAPMDRILDVARRHDLAVIEDCSHAHGAVYKGRAVGTWGDVGCFSLQASKAVDGGELGIALTQDPDLYDRMLLLGHPYAVRVRQLGGRYDVGDASLGVKYRPHLFGVILGHASFKRLARRNRRGQRVWDVLCEELDGVAGLRPQATLPEARRGGFYAFVFRYEGERLGGPPIDDFVAAVRRQGVPIDTDQFKDGLLHRSPIFTQLDRRALGGGCYDATRPWEENLAKVDLPASEEAARSHVRFPPVLYALPESVVREYARSVKRVLLNTVPQSDAADADAARPKGLASQG